MSEIDRKRQDLLHLSDCIQLPFDQLCLKTHHCFDLYIASKESVEDILYLQAAAYEGESPWSLDAIWQDMVDNRKSLYLIAYDDAGQAAAFISSWLVEGVCHITNLGVAPDFQRLGLATGLLQLLESVCQQEGLDRMSLEVRVSNGGAQALYVAFGFQPTYVLTAYYHDNQEDAVRMVKAVEDYGKH